jgi:hypothetical protein
MTSLGLPFQGEIRYYVETGYGTGSSPTGVGLPISIKVLDAKVGLSDKHKSIRGFDSPNAALLKQCTDYTFHLEYIPQCGDTLFEDAVMRSTPTDCSLEYISFYLQTNVCQGTDQTCYFITGSVNKSCKISSSINNEYIYVMDFDVKSVVTSSTPTGSIPTALTGEICAFNIAGSIKDGAGNKLAHLTNAIDVTIDNGTKSHFDHDSLDKVYAYPGELNIAGSCDISLNEGGGMHLSDVLAQNDFDIILKLGNSGCPEITLSNCRWKNTAIDVNIGGGYMKENAPFTATEISYATV